MREREELKMIPSTSAWAIGKMELSFPKVGEREGAALWGGTFSNVSFEMSIRHHQEVMPRVS